MKTKIIFILLLSLVIISCKKKSVDIDSKERIKKFFSNNEMKELLNYPVKLSESPSKKYIFVYAKGVEPFEDEDILKKDALKKDFSIDGFIFKKEEYKWCFIYDIDKKKIIFKQSNFILFVNPIWDEENDCIIFMASTSSNLKDLFFYNFDNKIKPYINNIYYINKKSYILSKDLKMIAYQYEYKKNRDTYETTDVGIKIRDISLAKDIVVINPDIEKSFLEIVRWETDNKLIYKEINKEKGIEELKNYDINK